MLALSVAALAFSGPQALRTAGTSSVSMAAKSKAVPFLDAPPGAPAEPAVAQPRGTGKLQRWVDGHSRYFDAMAILESFVAITSGILVWLGLWDLFTKHLLADTLAAKLTLVGVSLAALYGNRTLYDKQLIELRTRERARRMASVGSPAHAHEHAHAGPKPSERAQSDQLKVSGASLLLPVMGGDGSAQPEARARPDVRSASEERAALPMRRLYFDAPPLNVRALLRAMFALFANLSLWIGMYDAIDYHLLPALFSACVTCERPCAFVKASCIMLGLVGLYCTRALYGDVALKSANFQRMA